MRVRHGSRPHAGERDVSRGILGTHGLAQLLPRIHTCAEQQLLTRSQPLAQPRGRLLAHGHLPDVRLPTLPESGAERLDCPGSFEDSGLDVSAPLATTNATLAARFLGVAQVYFR